MRRGAKRVFTSALAVAVSTLAGAGAFAGENIGFILEPEVGASWVKIKSLEIEKSFITATDPDEEDLDDWEDLDPDSLQKTVGRKAFYEGSGFSLGISGALKIFNVTLGAAYIWDSITLDGYSKRYRYEPDRNRAGGRKFWDTGVIDLHRVMAQVGYLLPIWKFRVKLQTRIGSIYLDEGPLIIGRAIDDTSGFAGDVGVGLSFHPLSYLSIGVEGYFGFFSFSGQYEGAYGTIGGICGNFAISI